MNPIYPEDLPRGLHSGRKYQIASPLMRSDLVSGRSRQRRKFTSVPEAVSVSWLFNDGEGQLFEAWWRDDLVDGSLYFECPLDHPLGYSQYTARFTGPYSGPMRVGPELWSYTAELEVSERIALPRGWSILPSFVLHKEIFDYAMNREWPTTLITPAVLAEDNSPLLAEDGSEITLESYNNA